MSNATTGAAMPQPDSGEDRQHGWETLRGAPIFSELPPEVLGLIAQISHIREVPAGTLLCRQGELATRLYVLLDGQVTLSNVVHGDVAAVVEVVQTGGHFVLCTVLARLPYLMSATATTPARVVDIDGAGLVALIQQEPQIASAMLRAGAMDFSAMVRQVCDLKLRTTAQRLGCYLLELTGDETENSVSFRLPFDKRLLAARLGCRQENLSRAFATLRGLGVETHGSRVILHDIERLRNYATPVNGDAAEAQA